MKVRIAGAGCCLMDLLYPDADFSSPAFEALRSRREGDGGLTPGSLTFLEDAESFSGRPFVESLAELTRSPAAAKNVGGPSVVSLIHASQMLEGYEASVAYYGAVGGDETGRELLGLLERARLDVTRIQTRSGRTPSTFVLSDPAWDSGRGERCFVNEVGAAHGYGPESLGESFFDADIVALGGTALVPRLHEGLPDILARAQGRGALSVVNTVFDFRAERLARRSPKGNPVMAWSLGGRAGSPAPGPLESYRACDLLIMDRDEALRLAGERELPAALRFFASSGVGAFVVTRGGEGVLLRALGGRFEPTPLLELPVSERAGRERAEPGRSRGDTTGCGDAFAGGVIAALARQMGQAGGAMGDRGQGPRLDLADAVSWGIAAGAFTLGILGGTYYETKPGEKRELVAAYRDDWLRQAGSRPSRS